MQGVCFLFSYIDIVSSAKFVMIVEKDATFQRLMDDDFCTKLSPCIIITVCFFLFATTLRQILAPIHLNVVCFSERVVLLLCIHNRRVCVDQGKGVPDVNSRLMVRKLWDALHIPVFALVDADPHGTHRCSAHKPVFTSHTCLTCLHTFNKTPLSFHLCAHVSHRASRC